MKKLLISLIALLGSLSMAHSQDSQAWQEANNLYVSGEYAQAAIAYRNILDTHALSRKSQALALYNLGNAQFKSGELAQAILAYERSLRLHPTDANTRYNLAFAQSRIVDNIEDNQAFFVANWLKYIRNLLTLDTWLWLSIICFSLTIAGLILFLLSGQPGLRKSAFWIAVIALFICIAASANAASLHRRDTLRSEAIVTRGIVNAKASPDKSGTELFTLHEGTKVTIIETVGQWCNVHVGNNIGWLPLSTIERI